MVKKLGLGIMFLAAALSLTPRPAEAKWHGGVYVGPQFYTPYYPYYNYPGYGYTYPGFGFYSGWGQYHQGHWHYR
jgi:hypothetical protein